MPRIYYRRVHPRGGMTKKNLLMGMICLLAGWVFALDDTLADHVLRQFHPTKPCVQMRYEVSYRFMGIKLMNVAEAYVRATEGDWLNAATAERLSACVLDLSIKSPGEGDDRRDRRVFIDNQVLSVVTMPDINTLFYMKRTDEAINPFFKKPVINHSIHLYDLQSGEMDFFSKDYTTGIVSTNLDGAADFVSQGREVSSILKLFSDIYHERRGLLTPEDEFRISVNLEGRATPFTAETRLEKKSSSISEGPWDVIRIDVMPAPEAKGVRRKKFAMWATSLEQIAGRVEDEVLMDISKSAPEWGMVPMYAVMGMPLGYIRCELVEVSTSPKHTDLKPLT